jgi:protein disulfide-isomerase A6
MLAVSALALYSHDSAVITLTANNFKDLVINSHEFWLVEFYVNACLIQPPWCGHSKHLKPDYKKAAEILNGVMRIVAVNID